MPMHRVLIKDKSRVEEAVGRLRDHGYAATIGDHDDYGTALDFLAPADIDLDFLRPDFLPPNPAIDQSGNRASRGGREL